MVGSGRLIGLVLIGLAVAIVLIAGAFVAATLGSGLEPGGAVVTMACAIIPAVVIAGFGVWFLMHGRTEVAQFADVEKQKRILNIIQTQGTVQLASMALEMNMPLSQVKDAIYDLIGKGLFTGYVDWKASKLVSSDAAAINDAVVTGKCPNCGAPQVVAGKGVIRCEYCGAEFFLPKA
jgi:ribosomal protein S27E